MRSAADKRYVIINNFYWVKTRHTNTEHPCSFVTALCYDSSAFPLAEKLFTRLTVSSSHRKGMIFKKENHKFPQVFWKNRWTSHCICCFKTEFNVFCPPAFYASMAKWPNGHRMCNHMTQQWNVLPHHHIRKAALMGDHMLCNSHAKGCGLLPDWLLIQGPR